MGTFTHRPLLRLQILDCPTQNTKLWMKITPNAAMFLCAVSVLSWWLHELVLFHSELIGDKLPGLGYVMTCVTVSHWRGETRNMQVDFPCYTPFVFVRMWLKEEFGGRYPLKRTKLNVHLLPITFTPLVYPLTAHRMQRRVNSCLFVHSERKD